MTTPLPPPPPFSPPPTSSLLGPMRTIDFVNKDLKLAFKHVKLFAQLASEVLPPNIYDRLDWANARWLNPEFLSPQAVDRGSDVIWEVPWLAEPNAKPIKVVILVENQLKPLSYMALRIIIYMARIWDRELNDWEKSKKPLSELEISIVLPVVFHVSPESQWTKATTLREFFKAREEFIPYIPDWKTAYWSLIQHSVEDLLDSGKELFQTLAVARVQEQSAEKYRTAFESAIEKLSQSSNLGEAELTSLLELMLDYNLNKRSKAEWEELVAVAKKSFGQFKEFDKMVEVHKDSYVGEALQKGFEEGCKTGRTQGLAKGRTQGLAKGRTQGLAKGRKVGQLELLQRILPDMLQERFGPLPQDILDQIGNCQVPERLEAAVSSVHKLKSLQDFAL